MGNKGVSLDSVDIGSRPNPTMADGGGMKMRFVANRSHWGVWNEELSSFSFADSALANSLPACVFKVGAR